MAIDYMDSPLGKIKLVENDGELQVVHFMHENEAEEQASSTSFLTRVKQELQSYFDGHLQQFSFMPALAQSGTDFQHRVWELLTEIPFGKTISYRDLSIQLGDEKVIRAAASANGQNDIAIIVPCHRVIGSDGSLTGYAGGLWRKKWLLEHEAKFSGKPTQGDLFG